MTDNIRTFKDPDLVEKIFKYFTTHCTKGDLERNIVVSPIGGAYVLAGFFVAVEGSPPRGSFVVFTQDARIAVALRPGLRKPKELYEHGSSKKDAEMRYILYQFLEDHGFVNQYGRATIPKQNERR